MDRPRRPRPALRDPGLSDSDDRVRLRRVGGRPGAGARQPEGRWADADRGPRRRLLLGRARRLPARARRPRGALGILRGDEGDRGLRNGEPGRDRPRRVGRDSLRSEGAVVRRDPPDLLLSGSRSDAAQSPGPGRRHAVSLRDLLRRRVAEADRRGLHRPARPREGVPPAHRDEARAADGLLPGRGIPPGLLAEEPELPVYRGPRPAENREPQESLSRELPRPAGHDRDRTLTVAPSTGLGLGPYPAGAGRQAPSAECYTPAGRQVHEKEREDRMADKIRVGIVGATVTQGGSGWGQNAHVPALKALP